MEVIDYERVDMDTLRIAALKKQSIIVYADSAALFEVYNNLIRPKIMASNCLSIHQKISLTKITLFIKKDKSLQLINNFEIIHLLKDANTDHILLSQTLPVVQVSEEQFCIDTLFYELTNIIAKYQRLLDIEAVYESLNNILTPELNQQLFGKNTFSISTFCQLINIHEQTYYKRCEKDRADVKK